MTDIISLSSVKEVYIWSKLPAHGSTIHTSFYLIQMYGGAQGAARGSRTWKKTRCVTSTLSGWPPSPLPALRSKISHLRAPAKGKLFHTGDSLPSKGCTVAYWRQFTLDSISPAVAEFVRAVVELLAGFEVVDAELLLVEALHVCAVARRVRI